MKRILFPALLLLSACSPDFEWQETELSLRTLPGEEGLAFLLVEKGVGRGTDPDAAVNGLRQVLEGRRRVPPEGGFISIDGDEMLRKGVEDPDSLHDPEQRQFVELLKSTRVQKAGLFLDEKGRLALFQLWRVERPELLVRMCNEAANKSLVDEADSGRPFVPGFPWLDEASWKRGVARAREGGEWVRLDEKGVLVDFPITRECASRCLAALVEREDIRESYGALLASATSLDVGEDRTRIRFAPEASGWFRPIRYSSKHDYDDDLLTAVRASRLPIGPAPALEAMDKALRVPATPAVAPK